MEDGTEVFPSRRSYLLITDTTTTHFSPAICAEERRPCSSESVFGLTCYKRKAPEFIIIFYNFTGQVGQLQIKCPSIIHLGKRVVILTEGPQKISDFKD